MPKPPKRKFEPSVVQKLTADLKRDKPKNDESVVLPPPPEITRIKIITPPTLGEAAYQGKVGQLLRAVSNYTEATDAAILGHLLPFTGAIIGPKPYVLAGSKQPARVFSVIVGATNGGRKGTAAFVVDELFKQVDESFCNDHRVGGLSSGEGLIERLKDKTDADGNVTITDKRLMVVEEEFSRVLNNIRREGNILSEVIRQAFDSGNLSTLTVNPRQAFGAHISIVAHITPEELEERFSQIEMANGFGNRFLWMLVQSDKLIPKSVPFPPEVFSPIVPLLQKLRGAPDRCVPKSPEGEDLWGRMYPALREDKPGMVGAMTARGPAIVLRLALIYAYLDEKQVIEPKHLEAASAVWDYSVASANVLFESETGDKLGDKILQLLKDGPMTKQEFNRHLSCAQKRQFTATMARLTREKFVIRETVQQEGAGRPSTRWKRATGAAKLF